MPLPASGTIRLTDVMNELKRANAGRVYPISLGDADVRKLCGISSGAVSFTNLYGRSALTGTGIDSSTGWGSSTSGGGALATPSVTPNGGSGAYTYQWSFTSNPSGCGLNNATSQTAQTAKAYNFHEVGSYTCVLQCVITDSFGAIYVVGGITASATWS